MLKSIRLDSSIALDSCIGQESEGTDFKKKSKGTRGLSGVVRDQ